MRTIKTDDFNKIIAKRSVVTIGNFDGVHRGHRQVFSQVRRHSDALSASAVVVTFEPHPLKVLDPLCAPRLITTYEQKHALIAESDIDILTVIPFTKNFAAIKADDFVRKILCPCFGMRALVIGHDYAFGRGREGNEEMLKQLGKELDFEVFAIDPVSENDLLFSSSAARRLIETGAVAQVIAVLGRCHMISGRVVKGRMIGRAIGFPTANIVTENELLPSDGVYAVWCEVSDRLHNGTCSIGVNPTFGGGARTVEVFLHDFNAEIYGREITLHFADRIRDIACFEGKEQLVAQIVNDLDKTREILSSGLPARITI